MTEYGMTEVEFYEALRRQILAVFRILERRYGIALNVEIQVGPKVPKVPAEDTA